MFAFAKWRERVGDGEPIVFNLSLSPVAYG